VTGGGHEGLKNRMEVPPAGRVVRGQATEEEEKELSLRYLSLGEVKSGSLGEKRQSVDGQGGEC